MKIYNKLFTPPRLIFTLILALTFFTGCQVESDGSGNEPAAKNSYTVKFDANSGSGEMKALTAEEGTEITLAANAFTREGYTFSGWNTKSDGTGTAHTDKSKIKLTADITLYAQWTEIGKVEKVAFSATGEIDYNEKITLSCGTEGAAIYYAVVAGTDAPTAEEFSSSKQKYSEPITITENAIIAAVAVKDGMKDSETATATFTVKTYTVTFETEHGAVPAKIEGLKKGDKLTEEQLKALENVTGYKFDGWFNGETQFTAEMEITSDIMLTAKWTKTYTVTFDANGGTGSIDNITEVAGTEITLPESTFTKGGYIFAGWATTADGDVSYSDKATITLTGNITLYAKWGLTAAAAIEKIKSFADGEEHTVTVAGTITADDLTAIKDAINGNSSHPQIILDLGGTTGLTEIQNQAFYPCYYLISVNIPNCVTSIGGGAFAYCSRLTSVAIPDSVTSIGDSAFNTSGLSSVNIPNSVASIGINAFSNCTSLTSVAIPESITSIGEGLFQNCISLTSVTIPSSVTSIGDSAFSLCERLTSVNIPDSVTSIGMNAFSSCRSLTSVNIPGSVTSIVESAFYGCSGLTSVTIPDGVTTLKGTFGNCSNLTTVTIPKSVTSIGFATFYQCGNLTTVNYKGSKEDWDEIDINKDYNEPLLNAALICLGSEPKEVYTPADKAATVIAGLEGGTRANPNVCMVKIISKEESDKDFLKEINEKMYSRWNEYVKVNLDLSASGITEIPEKSFEGVNLLGITLPNSLESIKTKAFYTTYSLKKIVIPDNVRIIEAEAFFDCCYLVEITLPASLTNIGEYAFSGCDKLETVNYGGTKYDWSKIELGEGAFTSGTKITCSDGNVITIE